jgi:hypothetical protein
MFADFLQSRKNITNLTEVNSIDDVISFLGTRKKPKRGS